MTTGLTSFLRNFVEGKLMSIMPFLPHTMPSSRQPILELRIVHKPHGTSWEDLHNIREDKQMRPVYDTDFEIMVQNKDLRIRCEMDDRISEKIVRSRTLMSKPKHIVYFSLDFTDKLDKSKVKLIITIGSSEEIIEFLTSFADIAYHASFQPGRREAVSDSTLDLLAGHVPYGKYSVLAHILGIQFNEAQRILTENHNDYTNAIRQCLAGWKSKTGGSLTDLKEIFYSAELRGLLEYIDDEDHSVYDVRTPLSTGDPRKSSTDEVSYETLDVLAQHVPYSHYFQLANRLGMKFDEERSILAKHNHEFMKAIRECLHRWKNRTGGSSTELKSILVESELGALKEYLEQGDDEVDVSEAVERGMVTCNRSRIMVVGPAGVGKTCFICRLTSQGFRPDEPSTIGTINTSVTSGWKIDDKIRDATAESLFRYQEGAKNNKNSDVYPTSSATSGTTVAEQNAMPPLGASAAQPETTGAQSESAGAYPTTEGSESNVRAHKMASGRIHNVKSTANDVTYSIWDFGGQEIYYITHPLFLSWRALYIVVFPLHKQLTEGALREEQSCDDPLPGLVPRTHRTMRDLIHFWLMSIYIHAVPRPDIADASKFEPKILLVGTFHKDSTPDKIEQQKGSLCEIVKGKPYASQVISDIVEVDNKFSKEEEISKIQKLIDKHITDAEYMKEKLPIKWRLFLDEMNKLDQDTLKLEEAKDIMRDIGIDNEGVLGALQFCHEAGYLIFHPGCDLVVIRPKFLNDIVNNIITVNTNMKQEELSKDWEKVKENGVLSLSLVKAVWEQHGGKEDELDMVITMMIKFDLICEFQNSELQERQFYVPCLSSPDLHAWDNLKNDDEFEFVIEFKHVLPDGYLHRLYVRMTKWAIEQGGTEEPTFHCREMIFHVDDRHRVILKNSINGAEDNLITVIISAVSIPGIPKGKVSIDSGRKVITHLNYSLEDLKETWARRLSFSFCFPCRNCRKYKKLTLISLDKFLTHKGIAITCKKCPAPIPVGDVQQIFGNAASEITEEKLRELSYELGDEWAAVGTFLGVKNNDIQILRQQYPVITECIFQMLLKWRNEKGVQATKKKLQDAVSRTKRVDLVDFIAGSDEPDNE